MKGRQILVVDDEPKMRRVLEILLQKMGHRVLGAGNGVEALALFQANSIDLVITDLRMPEMDGIELLTALRLMFVGYAAAGLVLLWLYRRLPEPHVATGTRRSALGPSRRIVFKLAALFSVDSFAGGLALNSLMSLWLMQRFDMSVAAAGAFFFGSGLLAAASMLAAPWVARRIGLLNTMVFTHIPANLALIGAAFAPTLPLALGLLFFRAALSQMDVPTRTAYVMSVVTPAERAAAASVTAVPRSLASALSPSLAEPADAH